MKVLVVVLLVQGFVLVILVIAWFVVILCGRLADGRPIDKLGGGHPREWLADADTSKRLADDCSEARLFMPIS